MASLLAEMRPFLPSLLAMLAKIGGFVALAPTLGPDGGGFKYRVALAILLTLVLLPIAPATAVADVDGPPSMTGPVIAALAAGLLFGFAVRATVMGVTLASQLIERQLGLPAVIGFEDEVSETAVGRLYQLVALAIFILMDGHRLLIAGLLDTTMAGAAVGDAGKLVDSVLALLVQSFSIALQIAAPLVLALLAANLAVGMITRALPRFPGAGVALPAQVALGLVLILFSVAAAGSSMGQHLGDILRRLPAALSSQR